LRTLCGSQELTLSHSIEGWKTQNQLLAHFTAPFFPLTIEWDPIDSHVFFLIDQGNLYELITALCPGQEAPSFFSDHSYLHAFYHYFGAEVLRALKKQRFSAPLTPSLGAFSSDVKSLLTDDSYFVISLSLTLSGKNLWGKLLLPASFRKRWKSYFLQVDPPPLSAEWRQKLRVDVGLQVAEAQLSFAEWKGLSVGDFIILDHCSYDPQERKGALTLMFNERPLLRGRLKEGGIKITNYPIYEEVNETMDELEENEDLDEAEEELLPDLEVLHKKKGKGTEPSSVTEESLSIRAEDIPVHLTVEVGRIRMTAEELMSLSPGNLLDLHVAPEQGVDIL
ncbi:MAG: FliM/FliN family flagellar motor switch protein, partial [Chlamydiia bacterium]|nr:FliM/FliN family flagellar motor switch protein [Chlamydiia bacterium]